MKIDIKPDKGDSCFVNIFDIAELSIHDGPGVRTVVYFQGCNAQCDWCHSPQSQPIFSSLIFNSILCGNCGRCVTICEKEVHTFMANSHKIDRDKCNRCGNCVAGCPNSIIGVKGSALHLPTVKTQVDRLFAQIEPYIQLAGEAGGVTLSGGEALLQADAVKELLLLCKRAGFHTAIETSGLLPVNIYKSVAPLVDLWLFGMRVITGATHRRHDNTIRKTLKTLVESGAKILPRIPMIPTFFDRDDVLQSIISILTENNINTVCLNKWNIDYDINYTRSNMPLKMTAPTPEEVIICEDKITNTFINSKFNVYEN